jgi:hypothetical protein
MPHIVLTEEQAAILSQAKGPVEVRDTEGRPLASITVLTPEDREAIERHRNRPGTPQPGIPSEAVQAMLRKMHELERSEGVDEAKVKELVRRTRAGEPL